MTTTESDDALDCLRYAIMAIQTTDDLARQRRIWHGELIDCPACEGKGDVEWSLIPDEEIRYVACPQCHGSKRIRVGGDDPAKMIELLGNGADQDKLNSWADECERLLRERCESVRLVPISNFAFWSRQSSWSGGENCTVKPSEACAILRCCVPPPWLHGETVVCQECDKYHVDYYGDADSPCPSCDSTGRITLPFEFDPRWRTRDVLDLARVIRGGEPCQCHECAAYGDNPKCNKGRTKSDLSPDRFAILADALEDAGCDCADVIEHCRQGLHTKDCWVLEMILGAKP